MAFKTVVARSLLTAAALLATPRAFADDAPVEKPAVDRPALPQPSPSAPAKGTGSGQSSAHGSTKSEAPAHSRGSGGTHAAANTPGGGSTGERTFLYLAAGPGALIGLSGGQNFERTNPAL